MNDDITLGNQRLLQLADILDTADERHIQNQEPGYAQWIFVHACGTPACALGHWAVANPDRWTIVQGSPQNRNNRITFYQAVDDEFGLTENDYDDLFAVDGCGGARTSKQAANYIRAFVARRQS